MDLKVGEGMDGKEEEAYHLRNGFGDVDGKCGLF